MRGKSTTERSPSATGLSEAEGMELGLEGLDGADSDGEGHLSNPINEAEVVANVVGRTSPPAKGDNGANGRRSPDAMPTRAPRDHTVRDRWGSHQRRQERAQTLSGGDGGGGGDEDELTIPTADEVEQYTRDRAQTGADGAAPSTRRRARTETTADRRPASPQVLGDGLMPRRKFVIESLAKTSP